MKDRIRSTWLVQPILLFLLAAACLPTKAQTQTSPSTVTGDLRIHELTSKTFRNTRSIRILLPAGYDDNRNKTRRYPVLYLNDGQNLFDLATSLFNPREWRVDETVAQLMKKGAIEPIIVVGIDSAGRRMRFNEYFPYADQFLQPPMPSPEGKKYPDFVVDEVMPLVNGLYRTKQGRENTAIGGSSAGAIAALQAVIAKPKFFGLLLMESLRFISPISKLSGTAKEFVPLKRILESGQTRPARPNASKGT